MLDGVLLMTMTTDLLISDLDQRIVDMLRQRADRHGRTLVAEIQDILRREIEATEDFWAEADAIRRELSANGQVFSDSAELIREDRDR